MYETSHWRFGLSISAAKYAAAPFSVIRSGTFAWLSPWSPIE